MKKKNKSRKLRMLLHSSMTSFLLKLAYVIIIYLQDKVISSDSLQFMDVSFSLLIIIKDFHSNDNRQQLIQIIIIFANLNRNYKFMFILNKLIKRQK